MVNTINNAQSKARGLFENVYYDALCTVYELQKVKNEQTKITEETEIVVFDNQPCRLSFEKLNSTIQTETAAAITQSTKLFVSPELVIKGGSKITVTKDGRTQIFASSGKTAVYPTHQEITLELFKGWA